MTQSTPRVIIEELTSFSPAAAEDIRRLVAMLGKNFQLLTDVDVKAMLTSPATHLFIARDEETQSIVGMATLVIYRIPYVKKGYLDDLVVDKEYRGQGIGSQLLEKVLTCAQEQGASYVDFTSRPERVESNKMYEKFGFRKRNTNVYRHDFDHEKAE